MVHANDLPNLRGKRRRNEDLEGIFLERVRNRTRYCRGQNTNSKQKIKNVRPIFITTLLVQTLAVPGCIDALHCLFHDLSVRQKVSIHS